MSDPGAKNDKTQQGEQSFWNGQQTACARGWGKIAHDMPPLSPWVGAQRGDRIRVVRVFYAGDSFDLLDQDDRAWRKVTHGHGSPRYGHRNVRLEPYTFEPDDWGVLVDEMFRREGVDDVAETERIVREARNPGGGLGV